MSDCYESSLQVAVDNGIKTIAFPSISTGVYHFPIERAAEIAVSTVVKFLGNNPGAINLVKWVLFDERTEAFYAEKVKQYQ